MRGGLSYKDGIPRRGSITVWDVLGWLGAGMTEEQILDEHPDLEKVDFPAVYQFAAEAGRKANIG